MDTIAEVEKAPAYRAIKRCRVCGSDRLKEFWSGGVMQVVEFPLLGAKPQKPRVPLRLAVCEGCWLVQLLHTTDPRYLYETFWYRSGMNEMMRAELKGIANSAAAESDLKERDWVLDVGCNDGTLLENYPEGMNLVGIDPAKNLALDPQRKWAFVCDYFSDAAALMASDHNKFKVVTALAMFYDLEDPLAFCRQVSHILAPDGVFIVQMNYLPEMLKAGGVDNVCHEHLTYFSLDTLMTVFDQAGLDIYKVSLNKTNGGSIRVYACHSDARPLDGSVTATLNRELDVMRLHTWKPYARFSERVGQTCNILNTWLEGFKHEGRKVYAYGASTRGTTLLQLLDTRKKLIACAERDERKFGRYMVGADLPIVSEDEFRRDAEVALILPYHFFTSIWERESDWLDRGGRMIIPLPNPRIMEFDPWSAHGSGC
jgi:SAM-dependent methyltransferase